MAGKVGQSEKFVCKRLYIRHFNATMMMNYEVPEKVAYTRLRHSSTAITQDSYQHVLEDKDTETADILLDQALFQQ